MWVQLNDALVPEKTAQVSVFDRGFMYGDGVFETMRAYSGSVFCLDAHLDRLTASATALRMKLPRSPEQIASDIDAVLSKNGLTSAVVRVAISRGPGTRGPAIGTGDTPTYVIFTDSLPQDLDEQQRRGIRLTVVGVRRTPAASLPAHAKHANYLNSILARAEAAEAGADEALMLDTSDGLAECSASNLFFVRQSSLCTPAAGSGILPGIARSTVLELAAAESIQVIESQSKPSILDEAEEVFVTNSVVELMPVRSIDEKSYPVPGRQTERLRNLYRARVQRETSS